MNSIRKMLERLVLTKIVPHVSLSPHFDVSLCVDLTDKALLKMTDDIFTRFADHVSTIIMGNWRNIGIGPWAANLLSVHCAALCP